MGGDVFGLGFLSLAGEADGVGEVFAADDHDAVRVAAYDIAGRISSPPISTGSASGPMVSFTVP